MDTSHVEPAVIQRVVEPGSTETRHFILRNPPNGKITATIVGDRARIRLRDMMATVKREIIGEPVFCEELPPGQRPPGCQHGQLVQVPEVTFDLIGQMDGEGSMPVESGASVEGHIEFVAPAGAASEVTESVLRLRGENWDGLDVPIKMITGAAIVDFGPDPVVAHQGQTDQVPIRVSLPMGHPPTTLRVRGFNEAAGWESDAVVDIAGGQTVDTTLALTAPTTAPLGEASHTLTVSGWDDGNGSKPLTVQITTKPPQAVISFRFVRADSNGVLRRYERKVSATTTQPVHIGSLNSVGESFSYEYSAVDETGTLRLRTGVVTAEAKGRVQLGTVKLGGSLDGNTLTAKGFAEVVTARVDAAAAVGGPGFAGNANAHGEGPAARASAVISPDDVGVEVGASAGEIGGNVDITIGGKSFGAGGEIGLKAELGLHWGPTSTIKLPLITITGPNPMAGVTSFAAGAVTDLVRDPLRSSEETVKDIVEFGEGVVKDVGQLLETLGDGLHDLGGLLGLDDDDPNIVTVDEPQGFRPQLAPGAVFID